MLDEQVLQKLLQSGQLATNTPVWSEGMADWQPANRFAPFRPQGTA